jgi:hypothetical protein
MTTGTLPYLVDEVVTGAIADEGFMGESTLGLMYAFPPATRGTRERTASFGGLPEFSVKLETVESTEGDISQQFEKTFVHTVRAEHVKLSRELMDDVAVMGYGDVIDMSAALGTAFAQTVETLAQAPFEDADVGASYKAEDGLSICNSAHVNAAGGNSQDNLLANALDMDGIKATRNAMRDFTDYAGVKKSGVKPNGLIVPTELEEAAWVIVRSTGKPDGTLTNEANFYNGMFELFVLDQLTDADDWCMIDTRLMRARRNLRWYWRWPFSIFGDGNAFSGTRRVGAEFRSSHGVVDWRWICMNQV